MYSGITFTPKHSGLSAPVYEPHLWNRREVSIANCCYSYALNCRATSILSTSGAPGSSSGYVLPRPITAEGLAEALISDGLVPANTHETGLPTPKSGHYLIAAYLNDEASYHFYRQDKDGTWSHKAGIDSPVAQIPDGKTPDKFSADLIGRTLVGFFYVPIKGIMLMPMTTFPRGFLK